MKLQIARRQNRPSAPPDFRRNFAGTVPLVLCLSEQVLQVSVVIEERRPKLHIAADRLQNA